MDFERLVLDAFDRHGWITLNALCCAASPSACFEEYKVEITAAVSRLAAAGRIRKVGASPLWKLTPKHELPLT